MGWAYSVDLRERVVAAFDRAGMTDQEAAALFKIGEATVRRWKRFETRDWACRSHFLAPTISRISSSSTTSSATRMAPWNRVRRSIRKFSCVGSSSSATSFTGTL
jgi:hypothetical protein